MASTSNQYALSINRPFHQRLEMKILRHAMWVLNIGNRPEDEVKLANSVVMSNDNSYRALRLARFIATDPAFDAKVSADVAGETITDAELESAVATYFSKLA